MMIDVRLYFIKTEDDTELLIPNAYSMLDAIDEIMDIYPNTGRREVIERSYIMVGESKHIVSTN